MKMDIKNETQQDTTLKDAIFEKKETNAVKNLKFIFNEIFNFRKHFSINLNFNNLSIQLQINKN